MTEIWKDIKGFEGLYQVSNLGRIKSLERYVKSSKGTVMLVNSKILKPCSSGHYHYSKVTLRKNNCNYVFLIHRLVAEAFIPNIKGLKEIDHINDIKTDNRVDNLQWISHKLNCEKRNNEVINKNRCVPVCCFGINGFFVFESMHSAERITGIYRSNITKCINGLYKQCNGYKWFIYPLQPSKALPYFEALPKS